MHFLPFTLLLFYYSPFFAPVQAGNLTKGSQCNQQLSRLQTGTYQFWDECDTKTFCSSAGVCEIKKCRKDVFPFGYKPGDHLPPLCKTGEFCPDEEDACQPVLPAGSSCQMNRDDQCEGPSNWQQLADQSGHGRNFNGSVCLNNVCMWANATLGNACVVENTAYIAYESDGEFLDIVSRGNCALGLYCDSLSRVCKAEQALGQSCSADKECSSWNCLNTGVCGVSASVPHHFATWVYVFVAFGIFGGMFGTLYALYFTHKKQRDEEREKRLQYWREQNAFHQNLQQMRETARASLLSLPRNGGGSEHNTLYDDSQVPILHPSAPKSSGLRPDLPDDASFDYYDGYATPLKKGDRRF